jgi:hypothetical protein
MATEPKEQYCEWCGESTGVHVRVYGDHESCGSFEYERELTKMDRERDEERAERAREDDYSRY